MRSFERQREERVSQTEAMGLIIGMAERAKVQKKLEKKGKYPLGAQEKDGTSSRPISPHESEDLKTRYTRYRWLVTRRLYDPSLSAQERASLRVQNLYLKKAVGRDIRSEEDTFNALNRLYSDLEENSPDGAEHLKVVLEYRNKRNSRGEFYKDPVRRIHRIALDVQTGKIFDSEYKLP